MPVEWIGVNEDLPFHSRIGLGHHAGFAAIQEDTLLNDAFYLLVAAEKAQDELNRVGAVLKKSKLDRKFVHHRITPLSSLVATYSRSSMVTFYSFVEALVNSVGHDRATRISNNLTAENSEILQGTKKGRFLSLEYKLEKYPQILNPGARIKYVITDPKQVREPFQTFLEVMKEARDSAMHHAPGKANLWRPPSEWLSFAELAAANCMAVAREFLSACCPDSAGPKYLGLLEDARIRDLAERRFELRYLAQNESFEESSSGGNGA